MVNKTFWNTRVADDNFFSKFSDKFGLKKSGLSVPDEIWCLD